jgi:membrane protein
MTGRQDADGNARDDVPDDPTDLSGGSWVAAAKRTLKEYKDDGLQDRAAALTYFGIQSIFPGLLVLVALLGFVGRSGTQPLISSLSKAAPASIGKIITSEVTHLQHSHAASGIVGIVGIVLALWSASNYVSAFMRASNAIYDVPEGRPLWKTGPIRLGVTLVTMILLVAAAAIVVVTGGLAQKVGNILGIGPTAVTVWEIAKWPALLVIIGLILAILYWASPNARRGFQWVSPGGFIAVVLWLIASALFALYVANFGHYNKVYGSLAGVIIFLIWMWISNVASCSARSLTPSSSAAAPSPPGIRSRRSPSPNYGMIARSARRAKSTSHRADQSPDHAASPDGFSAAASV